MEYIEGALRLREDFSKEHFQQGQHTGGPSNRDLRKQMHSRKGKEVQFLGKVEGAIQREKILMWS